MTIQPDWSSISLVAMPHQAANGTHHMAWDEAMVTWLQAQPQQMLLIRTYTWTPQTLSFGVHQSTVSRQKSMAAYQAHQPFESVQRPTGGRAILHGDDISFAFATNIAPIVQASLADSYCLFSTWIRRTLEQLQVPLQTSCDAGESDYLASPVCFETRTPWDLVAASGEKLCGSAQLRRHGAILQHGAAFLATYGITPSQFEQALQQTIQAETGQGLTTWQPDSTWETGFAYLKAQYQAALTTA